VKEATMTEPNSSVIPQPAAQLADLTFFTGVWDADGTFFATPFSAQKPIQMRITVEPEHRGFWVRTRAAELPSHDNPNPLSATYLWGFDPQEDRFIAEWFDSNGGRASQTSPGWNGDLLVFNGQMTAGGFTFALRDTFTRRGDNEYHHLGEVDLGQGWIPVDEENARRASA
jgi:hypothetical protein